MDYLEKIMPLIIYGGDAKSHAVEAIHCAKEGDFQEATDKLVAARASLLEAHHAQTDLLKKEAQEESVEVTLLMVHAQDHLMNGITFVDLATELVEVYQVLYDKKI